MIETFTYREVFSESILEKYDFLETGSAARIARATSPHALADIADVLDKIDITYDLIMSPGGSRGPLVRIVDGMFHARGWVEARVDLAQTVYLFKDQPKDDINAENDPDAHKDKVIGGGYSIGYSIDNYKQRIALDCEWNAKDGNLDRDFAAFRAWHRAEVIDAAFLFTRTNKDMQALLKSAWADYFALHPQMKGKVAETALGTSTTTNWDKARPRIVRGDLDTCPLLMIAVKPSTITPGSMSGAKYVWVGGKDVETPHFDYVDYETKEVRASYTIGRDGLIQLAGV